ncbi:hypothetical protein A4D02_19810 [Niastella koreensis]|uniref:Uncharacterized protein n=1 Tax=Niastella koreensis TaxID=354356 RepID=A0ABX3P2T2_9BACT|nr:hypothetical protein [Niastella koreensis]OQP53941.1 hypothetical protein A4D02_19810 [Niastella koreensis]
MRNAKNKTTENHLLKSEWKGIQHRQIKQKEITKTILHARQNERIKIAHEIQDNLNQVLIAALHYIDLAKTDEESREICLEKSSSFISTVINELANMSQTLTVRDIEFK